MKVRTAGTNVRARRATALLTLGLLLLAGAVRVVSAEPLPAWLPPGVPGKLVDLGTHSLYIHCRGTGSPTVVFDNGLGGLHYEWQDSADLVSRSQRVCVYDRGGYGLSEAGPMPRNTSRLTDELHLLLRRAGERPPFLLVGHSFGGYTAQLFARRYPEAVAGVVLVDASHPEQVERYLAPPLHVNTAPSRRGRVVRTRAPKLPLNYPAEHVAASYEFLTGRAMRYAVAEEFFEFRASARAVRRAPDFPDVPLLVLTHGRHIWPKNELGERCEALWEELQGELADLSRLSAHVVADRSGHHIQLDQPRLIADAVQLVAGTAQQLARNDFTSRRRAIANRVGAAPSLPAAVEDDTLIAEYLWLAFDGATWRSDRLHKSMTMLPSFARLGDTSLRSARLNFTQQLDAMNPIGSFGASAPPN